VKLSTRVSVLFFLAHTLLNYLYVLQRTSNQSRFILLSNSVA